MRRYLTIDVGFLTVACLVSAALAVLATRWIDRIPIDWHLTSEAVAHFAEALGVVIGGIWAYFVTKIRRSLEPRAELKHGYQTWEDATGRVLRIVVMIRNPSEALLRPGDGMTRVQKAPTDDIDANQYAYDKWTDIAKIRHAIEHEELRIEPKETEIFVHDVRVDKGVRFIQLYTWISCRRLNRKETSVGTPVASTGSKSPTRPTAAIDGGPTTRLGM